MIPPSPAWASKPVEFDALRKPVESTVEERFSLDPVILDEADGEDHENMDALGDIAANGMSNSDILSLLNAAGLDEEEDHEEGEGGGGEQWETGGDDEYSNAEEALDAALERMPDRNAARLLQQSRSIKSHVYPMYGTKGLLGNAHCPKCVVKVVLVEAGDGEYERIKISLLNPNKCLQGMQGYNPDSRTDYMKQTRANLGVLFSELPALVTRYLLPHKTKRERHQKIADKVLAKIRATLEIIKQVHKHVQFAKRINHRRPFRVEYMYFFEDLFGIDTEVQVPIPQNTSLASCFFEVDQGQVYHFEMKVEADVYLPVFSYFGRKGDPPPPVDDLDAAEKTYFTYAIETMPRLHGWLGEGTTVKSMRLNGWGSVYSHQPIVSMRVPPRQATTAWCPIPYGLDPKIRACNFVMRHGDTGSDTAERERHRLEQDIVMQSRNLVRNPIVFAKGMAVLLNGFHRYAAPPVLDYFGEGMEHHRYGLFEPIDFPAIASLPATSRTEFIDECIEAIVEAYHAEWRAVVDTKLRKVSAQNAVRRRRLGDDPIHGVNGLEEDAVMPKNMTQLHQLITTRRECTAVIEDMVPGAPVLISKKGEWSLSIG